MPPSRGVPARGCRHRFLARPVRSRLGRARGLGLGPGDLHQAIAALDASGAPAGDAAEITRRALDGSCPTAVAALQMFCALLGAFAGNVALMSGPRRCPYRGRDRARIVGFLERSEFRRRFEDKGRFQSYLAAIPTSVIVHPAAAFLGLRGLAASEQRGRALSAAATQPQAISRK